MSDICVAKVAKLLLLPLDHLAVTPEARCYLTPANKCITFLSRCPVATLDRTRHRHSPQCPHGGMHFHLTCLKIMQ
ncbi:hypothetical protein GOP47_0023421 [Adiantum capillus-veneris]|uniref:Uncharacterized protein n=1 Tax=Adiantum capillus-veneris TaxID=13818 RepID=A0A9D4U617_ADICA|nr:hypothetical protein GOP47_0023421 [Adiantum capillus-veneris]